jgi:hypothetical protein
LRLTALATQVNVGYHPLAMNRFILLLFVLTACGGGPDAKPDKNPGEAKVLRGADRYPIEGLIVVKADLNGDTIPDVYSIYKEDAAGDEPDRRLVRKEIDVNFDGGVDIWRHFGGDGKMVKEELDYNFDGRVDAVNIFDNGDLVRKEVDVEFDQAADVFKYYKRGELIRIERDTNNDGRIDFWEYYERGILDRVGRDNNHDGRVDTWQER